MPVNNPVQQAISRSDTLPSESSYTTPNSHPPITAAASSLCESPRLNLSRGDDDPPPYAEATTDNPQPRARKPSNGITDSNPNGVEQQEVNPSNSTQTDHPSPNKTPKPTIPTKHPRVAVLLDIKPVWYLPLLICRGLVVAPATWWGLRYAVVFLGELLFAADGTLESGAWSVEKRFRVTEVFLAILWVWVLILGPHAGGLWCIC